MSRVSFRIAVQASEASWFAATARARLTQAVRESWTALWGRPMTRPSLCSATSSALDVDDHMGGGVREHAHVARLVGLDERHVGDRGVAAVVDRRRRRARRSAPTSSTARSSRSRRPPSAVIVTFTTAPAPATPSGIANDAHRRHTSARAGVDHPLRCRQLPAVPDGAVERADAVDDDVRVAVAVHAHLAGRVAADHRQVRRCRGGLVVHVRELRPGGRAFRTHRRPRNRPTTASTTVRLATAVGTSPRSTASRRSAGSRPVTHSPDGEQAPVLRVSSSRVGADGVNHDEPVRSRPRR